MYTKESFSVLQLIWLLFSLFFVCRDSLYIYANYMNIYFRLYKFFWWRLEKFFIDNMMVDYNIYFSNFIKWHAAHLTQHSAIKFVVAKHSEFFRICPKFLQLCSTVLNFSQNVLNFWNLRNRLLGIYKFWCHIWNFFLFLLKFRHTYIYYKGKIISSCWDACSPVPMASCLRNFAIYCL